MRNPAWLMNFMSVSSHFRESGSLVREAVSCNQLRLHEINQLRTKTAFLPRYIYLWYIVRMLHFSSFMLQFVHSFVRSVDNRSYRNLIVRWFETYNHWPLWKYFTWNCSMRVHNIVMLDTRICNSLNLVIIILVISKVTRWRNSFGVDNFFDFEADSFHD